MMSEGGTRNCCDQPSVTQDFHVQGSLANETSFILSQSALPKLIARVRDVGVLTSSPKCCQVVSRNILDIVASSIPITTKALFGIISTLVSHVCRQSPLPTITTPELFPCGTRAECRSGTTVQPHHQNVSSSSLTSLVNSSFKIRPAASLYQHLGARPCRY